jgi:probable rRNA maturation factor
VDRRLLRRRARRVLAELRCEAAELSVALADDGEIAELNARFRGKQGPTDVLSFSLLEGAHAERRGALLGDVVLGVEVAARQAARARRALDDELARLLVHGVLHLLGHDHQAPAETARMRAEERRLLRALEP